MEENAEDFDQLAFTRALEQHLEADVSHTPALCSILSVTDNLPSLMTPIQPWAVIRELQLHI